MRGRIQRKQNADKLRQLQALVRAHARAQAGILPVSEALHLRAKASRFSHHTVRAAHISFPSIEFGYSIVEGLKIWIMCLSTMFQSDPF